MDNNLIGINTCMIAGTVDSSITVNKTAAGVKACTFLVRIVELGSMMNRGVREPKTFETVVRINAYGKIAEFCSERVTRGAYVVVRGELTNYMNVQRNISTTDVKARQVIMVPETAETNIKLEGIRKPKEADDNE